MKNGTSALCGTIGIWNLDVGLLPNNIKKCNFDSNFKEMGQNINIKHQIKKVFDQNCFICVEVCHILCATAILLCNKNAYRMNPRENLKLISDQVGIFYLNSICILNFSGQKCSKFASLYHFSLLFTRLCWLLLLSLRELLCP